MITVVIPAHNPDESLGRAVESVRRYLPDAEVIVVDDGSETPVAHGDFRLVRQPNLGASSARNTGARLAHSEWLIFLDDDDELLPDIAAAAELTHGSAGLISCGFVVGGVGSGTHTPALAMTAGSFLVRREVWEEVGGYDELLTYSENTDFVIRCAAVTPTVVTEALVMRYWIGPAHAGTYDGRRVDAIERILQRGRPDLTSTERSKLHGIAAVNASRTGQYVRSSRHGWASLRHAPSPRAFARFALSMTGPLGRRVWLRDR